MDTEKVNVNPVERIVSTVLGGALLIQGLTRRSLGREAIAIALLYRGVSGHSYLYQALGVNTADSSKQHETGASADAPEVERSITIGKPADELYRFWREPKKLSQILGDFVEVTEVSKDRTHWLVRGPFALRMEWDTQVVEDRPGEILRWESLEGADLPNEGSVCFRPAPGDWGTEAMLRFRFDPPGGALGNKAAKRLSIVPRLLADKVLRRFKSLAETGEIPTLEHNPSARTGAHAHSRAH